MPIRHIRSASELLALPDLAYKPFKAAPKNFRQDVRAFSRTTDSDTVSFIFYDGVFASRKVSEIKVDGYIYI